MTSRARFTWQDDGKVVAIEDRDLGGRSVTNDIEAVLADLAGYGIDLDKRRVVYRDSDGLWDGVATKNKQFAGFILLRELTLHHATIAALHRETWP